MVHNPHEPRQFPLGRWNLCSPPVLEHVPRLLARGGQMHLVSPTLLVFLLEYVKLWFLGR
ncbi:MAG TPA: hypothetical protein VMR62_01210 [Bryobacteraceae bacterium]|nr:hypothetical protein [Bryobacteraceae bacterium]